MLKFMLCQGHFYPPDAAPECLLVGSAHLTAMPRRPVGPLSSPLTYVNVRRIISPGREITDGAGRREESRPTHTRRSRLGTYSTTPWVGLPVRWSCFSTADPASRLSAPTVHELQPSHSTSYPRKLTAFCAKLPRPWSYLITVYGSPCFDIICTRRQPSPESKARVMAVLRRSCCERSPILE